MTLKLKLPIFILMVMPFFVSAQEINEPANATEKVDTEIIEEVAPVIEQAAPVVEEIPTAPKTETNINEAINVVEEVINAVEEVTTKGNPVNQGAQGNPNDQAWEGEEMPVIDMDEVPTPAEQQIIQSYEGKPAMAFDAKDTYGTRHSLSSYKGRVVVLYFWSTENEESYIQIPSLERLQAEYPSDKVTILTMAKEDDFSVEHFKTLFPFTLPVIPSAEKLGSGYAKELSVPRAFVVDTNGVVGELYIGEHFKQGPIDLYFALKPRVEAMVK